ncbi:hypothetical protein DMB37_26950 [Nocardia sp. CS682]|nr:hypothetical protein DMB37_26950 [Nocardia sp. CS682]
MRPTRSAASSRAPPPSARPSSRRENRSAAGEQSWNLLARLTLSGSLRTTDPAQAAERLLALLTAPLDARSKLGTRAVSDAELRHIAEAAIHKFLSAYGSH